MPNFATPSQYRPSLALLILAFMGFDLAACSPADEGQSSTNGPDAGTHQTGGRTGTGEGMGGAPSAGGTPPAGGAAGADSGVPDDTPERTGFVHFIDEYGRWPIFSARFVDSTTTVPNSRCTRSVVGDCRVTICRYGDGFEAPPPPPPPLHAGRISYEQSQQPGVIYIEPVDDGRYTNYVSTQDGRDPLAGYPDASMGTFWADGGDIPAFEQDVYFPLRALLEEPATDAGVAIISAAEDVNLRWLRGEPWTEIHFEASMPSDGERGVSVVCTFDGGSGQGLIPAEVIAELGPSSTLRLFAINRETLWAGDYFVTLRAGASVMNPERTAAIQFVIE
jgi:hypothetical protein